MFSGLLSHFADDGPAVHVAPATNFTIGGLHITNSMFYGWLVLIAVSALLIWGARKITLRPKGGALQYLEAGVGFVTDLVENAFGDKQTGRKYVPFFVTLFFIVLLNNWSGLVPGVGEALTIHGHPLLRPMTADLNATLSMGLVTMVVVYIASVREVGGVRKYIRHFFIGSPLNPLYLVIGLIEMLTDITRALSLALRLFLNVTIGEIVIAVFAFLGGMLLPHSLLSPVTAVPFTLLELGVGALQAYIFVILGVNYLAITVNSAHSHDDHLTEPEVVETIEAAPRGARG
ncbi:MAG TPA: F0F1 ATP synthase subunit A [Candidatus Saccharimonadales bacterium]|nr:F0F1 ATP synthase subunit A [Candidatus Saccharimonadales bacterium]